MPGASSRPSATLRLELEDVIGTSDELSSSTRSVASAISSSSRKHLLEPRVGRCVQQCEPRSAIVPAHRNLVAHRRLLTRTRCERCPRPTRSGRPARLGGRVQVARELPRSWTRSDAPSRSRSAITRGASRDRRSFSRERADIGGRSCTSIRGAWWRIGAAVSKPKRRRSVRCRPEHRPLDPPFYVAIALIVMRSGDLHVRSSWPAANPTSRDYAGDTTTKTLELSLADQSPRSHRPDQARRSVRGLEPISRLALRSKSRSPWRVVLNA